MTGLKRMIGLPVILDGKAAGCVMRSVLTEDGRALRGIIMRGGLRDARRLPREQINLVGKISVIGKGKSRRLPRAADYRLFRVMDTEGERLSIVTDVLLNEETLRVAVQQIEGFFLSPFLMAGATGLHPVYVVLLLSAGGMLFGLAGMMAALPVFLCIRGGLRIFLDSGWE